MSLILRQVKGSKLTIQEMDDNFTYLENLATTQIGANYAQTVAGSPVNGITSAGTIVSVEITTNGYPVQITVTGDANPVGGAGNWCQLQIFRDGSSIGNIVQAESSADNENVPYTLNYIDNPSTGTYTYTLEVVDIDGEFNFGEADGPVITAIELANRNWSQDVVDIPVVVPGGNDAQLASVNITTTGAPVQLMATGDANNTSSGASFCKLQFYRDGNPIGNVIQAESSDINENVPFALNFIDVVPSGNYTYTLRVIETAGSDYAFGEADGPVMTAVELVSGGGSGDSWSENNNSVCDSNCSNSKGGNYNSICCSNNSTIIGGEGNLIGVSYNGYYSCVESSCNNGIFAGKFNQICESDFSVILGGCCNCICSEGDNFNSIMGGACNTICGATDYSTIIAGYGNIICGDADSDYSAIIGGQYNCNYNSQGSVILGGCCNVLENEAYCSGILAGECNCINYSCQAVVVGGYENCIMNESEGSVILGGAYGEICDYVCQSAIVAGYENCIHGSVDYSSIIAGCRNEICCNVRSSSIIGGRDNNIYCCVCSSTIIGGGSNDICGGFNNQYFGAPYYVCQSIQGDICNSSILSGNNNSICDAVCNSTILGGRNNRLRGELLVTPSGSYECFTCESTIIGGSNNAIEKSQASLIMASYADYYSNRICNSCQSSIISSCSNYYGICISNSESSTIISSRGDNEICESSSTSIISSNNSDICSSYQSSIIGGCNHYQCDNNNSIIAGGDNSCIESSSNSTIVGGGYHCMGNSIWSAMIGGSVNQIQCSGKGIIIGGNSHCVENSYYGAIINGFNSTLSDTFNSSIIGSNNSSICGSTSSMIIGGSNLSIINQDNIILIPTLSTATFSSSATYSQWKLGNVVNEGALVLDSSKYVSVEINGQTYNLALATI